MRSRLLGTPAALISISLISAPTIAAPEAARAEDDVAAILDEIDDLYRGLSSKALVTMEVKTASYERSLKMEAWSKGKEMTLVRILTPLREKDTATLKSGGTIYTYLPKSDRTIRLTSGMMSGAWMGSHFTNDDLVKESRLRDDFTAQRGFRGAKAGREVLEVILTPKSDAAVVWGKILLTVDMKTRLPIEQVYYDEDGKAVRTATFATVKTMGGRTLPSTLTMVPADKPDEHTRITYESLDLDAKLEDDFFSVARLKRSGR